MVRKGVNAYHTTPASLAKVVPDQEEKYSWHCSRTDVGQQNPCHAQKIFR